MKSEIISVGTEILIGDIVDTNSEYISKRLAELGVNCYYHTTVGDNVNRLTDTFRTALERSNVIIFTGGLGPTYDDMTKEIVADTLGLEMVYDQESYQRIQEIFKKSSRKLTDNNRKQAFIPKRAKVLTNYEGTAPGILIEHEDKVVILLPGPPHELKEMFENWVIPYFHQLTDQIILSHRVYLFGIGESYIEEILREDMVQYTNPTIAPYAYKGNIYLRITASAKTEEEANALIKPVIKHVKAIFKDYVYSVDIPTLEEALVKKLKSQNKTLATAESCTGGSISKRITNVSGSSDV
ncbi:MAG TPA: CinA family nicotinamide mononucleotide deamidase-related protein, partial [Erysipelothrix sp.]|nr:CinA family nicotinamide mononucleotide deamidase-related protein [Erysipelothrix sp.]